jgi:hypothetical protein
MDLPTPQILTEKEQLALRRGQLEIRRLELLRQVSGKTPPPRSFYGNLFFSLALSVPTFYLGLSLLRREQLMLAAIALLFSSSVAMWAIVSICVLPMKQRLDALITLLEEKIRPD